MRGDSTPCARACAYQRARTGTVSALQRTPRLHLSLANAKARADVHSGACPDRRRARWRVRPTPKQVRARVHLLLLTRAPPKGCLRSSRVRETLRKAAARGLLAREMGRCGAVRCWHERLRYRDIKMRSITDRQIPLMGKTWQLKKKHTQKNKKQNKKVPESKQFVSYICSDFYQSPFFSLIWIQFSLLVCCHSKIKINK